MKTSSIISTSRRSVIFFWSVIFFSDFSQSLRFFNGLKNIKLIKVLMYSGLLVIKSKLISPF